MSFIYTAYAVERFGEALPPNPYCCKCGGIAAAGVYRK
jgi:hypothetical protein